MNYLGQSLYEANGGGGGGGTGDVVGPGSSTLNAVPRFSDTSGTLLKDSPVVVSDAGVITGSTSITANAISAPSGTLNVTAPTYFSVTTAPATGININPTQALVKGTDFARISGPDTSVTAGTGDVSIVAANDIILNPDAQVLIQSLASPGLVIQTATNISSDLTVTATLTVDDIITPRILDATLGQTGVLSGGDVTEATPTTFNVSAGSGMICFPNSISKFVAWDAKLGESIYVGSFGTFVAIDELGNIVKKVDYPFSAQERRTYIVLAEVSHANLAVIDYINKSPYALYTGNQNLVDLSLAIGILNLTGNIFSPNGANLKVNKSAGSYFSVGSNFSNNPRNPNVLERPALTTPLLYRFLRGGQTTVSTDVNPGFYDLNGVLTAVPNNSWTVQRFYMLGTLIGVAYGQVLYTSFADAFAKHDTEVINGSQTDAFLLRAYLIVKKNATNLSNQNEAVFVAASKFGGGGAGGGAGGNGDVIGAASSTTNAITRYADPSGKSIKNSTAILSDTGLLTATDFSTATHTSFNTDVTTLETKTQNLTATAGNTTFVGDVAFTTGALQMNGTSVQIQNSSTLQIQNAGTCSINPTGALTLKAFNCTGALAMGTNKITGLGAPTADADAATKKYVDDQKGVTAVYTTATLPTAVGKTGQIVYVSNEGNMAFSNGSTWIRMANSVTGFVQPAMTSDTTPAPFVVTTNSTEAPWVPWKGFDGVLTGTGNWWHTFTGAFSAGGVYIGAATGKAGVPNQGTWLVLEFNGSVPIRRYQLYPRFDSTQGNAKSWHIIYSTDGVTYSVADTKVTQTMVPGTPVDVTFTSPIYAKYWGVQVYESQNPYMIIQELRFLV
jgi:hypothetical protein